MRTVAEVAKEVGRTQPWIRRLIARGVLTAHKEPNEGGGSEYRYVMDEDDLTTLYAYIEAHKRGVASSYNIPEGVGVYSVSQVSRILGKDYSTIFCLAQLGRIELTKYTQHGITFHAIDEVNLRKAADWYERNEPRKYVCPVCGRKNSYRGLMCSVCYGKRKLFAKHQR